MDFTAAVNAQNYQIIESDFRHSKFYFIFLFWGEFLEKNNYGVADEKSDNKRHLRQFVGGHRLHPGMGI